MPYPTTTDTPRVPISEALAAASAQGFLKAKFRLKEEAPTKNGGRKRECTLSFQVDGNWYTYSHTLFGYRLRDFEEEAERLNEQWAPFGIGSNRDSTDRPTEFGKIEKLLFPSEVATTLDLDTLVKPLVATLVASELKELLRQVNEQLTVYMNKPIHLTYRKNDEDEDDLDSHPF